MAFAMMTMFLSSCNKESNLEVAASTNEDTEVYQQVPAFEIESLFLIWL